MLMLTQVLLPTREQQCGTGGASHPAGQVSSPASDDRRAPMSSTAERSSPGPAQHHAAVQTFSPNDVTCC